jgi:hypothetical protein
LEEKLGEDSLPVTSKELKKAFKNIRKEARAKIEKELA